MTNNIKTVPAEIIEALDSKGYDVKASYSGRDCFTVLADDSETAESIFEAARSYLEDSDMWPAGAGERQAEVLGMLDRLRRYAHEESLGDGEGIAVYCPGWTTLDALAA